MTIKIGTGSGAVEPSALRMGSGPAQRVMVGTGNDAVPVWVYQAPPMEPLSFGGGRTAHPGYAKTGTLVTFYVEHGGMAHVHVKIDGPSVDYHWGSSLNRYFGIMNPEFLALRSWSGPNPPDTPWIVDETTGPVRFRDNTEYTIYLRIDADEPLERYLNSWSVDIIPVAPAVDTSTILTVSPTEAAWGDPVTLTATVTPSNAVGSVTFDGAGETSTVPLVNGVATTTRTFYTSGEYEVSAEFTPTSEEDFLPSSGTSSITVVEGAPQVVEITGTSGTESRQQLRDALTARGLDYATVETLPFALDTSQATNLNGLFQDCAALTSVPELDTSNVTNMSNMFYQCGSLSTVPPMDTSKVTNMSAMYAFNPSLTSVPEMDTSNVTNMSFMFSWCTSLAYVPDMDTSNVTNMESMLSGTSSLTDGNIRLIGKHPSVNTTGMIEFSALTVEPFFVPAPPAVETTTSLSVVPNEITEGEQVILTATVTPSEAVGEVTFTLGTQTSTVALAGGTASTTVTLDTPGEYGATAEFVPTDEADFTASSDTGSVTVTAGPVILTGSGTEPRDQFRAALSSLGLSHGSIEAVPFPLDTSEATSLQGLFSSCSTLTEVPEMDTSSVTNMSHMFNGCRKLTNIPDMDTSKVTNMSYMFAACSDLTEAPEMDTSSVTDMAYMFQVCSSLTYIPDMDTSNVTNMRYTLMGTSALVDGNVRFLGKHPDVAAINVIQGSSLTRVPWYEVETQTTLVVVPEEIEEGESVTVTATVTPPEAAGVIEFDVAGQLSTVNVVNGEASTSATLDEAGEHAITADFVPASALDYLPSSATGSVTVTEPAPTGIPVTTGADKWLRFDPGSPLRDTISGQDTLSVTPGRATVGDGRIDFSGTNTGAPVTSTMSDTVSNGGLTFSCWFYAREVSGGRFLMERSNLRQKQYVYLAIGGGVGTVYFRHRSSLGQDSGQLLFDAGWQLNRWHHIVFRMWREGSNWVAEVYLDGVRKYRNDRIPNGLHSIDFTPKESLYVGSAHSGGIPFDGLIDDVVWWSHNWIAGRIDESVIPQLYEAGRSSHPD